MVKGSAGGGPYKWDAEHCVPTMVIDLSVGSSELAMWNRMVHSRWIAKVVKGVRAQGFISGTQGTVSLPW